MLTICSVSYYSKPYLELNQNILGKEYPWLIVQNDTEENLPDSFVVEKGENAVKGAGNIGYGSFSHASGLNYLIRQVKTRYALLVDPDFFIFRPLAQILEHMDKHGLEFFGAPYFPSERKRVFEFPTAFCMFIDLSKVGNELDFTPSGDFEWAGDTGYKVYEKYKPTSKYGIAYPSFLCKKQYGIKHDFEEYAWHEKIFGVHTHMKVHLRSKMERETRAATQLGVVKKIAKRTYNDFTV